MIRQTLSATQLATYSIDLPNPDFKGMPYPTGTGFFVSEDGWFVTAAHVVTKDNLPGGTPRDDFDEAWLMKETRAGLPRLCQNVQLDLIEPDLDFALLKVDFQRNSNKEHLKGKSGFPHLVVSTRQLEEGEPVYAFGYPLPTPGFLQSTSNISGTNLVVSHVEHRPRTTSAIVAATLDTTKMVSTSNEPQVYVLDKALNYGNSGGPIVAVDTGKVHALCSRFQPMQVPQPNLQDKSGKQLSVQIPSLYGVVSSLRNGKVQAALRQRGVPLSER